MVWCRAPGPRPIIRHFMTILVTGAAGFIGYHVARRLAERGGQVVGVDNLTDFYGTELKRRRLVQLSTYPNFKFYRLDLSEKNALLDTLRNEPVEHRHPSRRAGANVRYAIENPHAYVDSNVAGHLNVLEYCRNARGITNLIYASSSSVHGARNPIPFREGGETDRPTSLYAATKKSQEMMSQVYADIFGVPQIGLRFFSVYGPWGRPDMSVLAVHRGDRAEQADPRLQQRRHAPRLHLHRRCRRRRAGGGGRPDGRGRRSCTASTMSDRAEPVALMDMIRILQDILKKRAIVEMMPMQPGEMTRYIRRHIGDRRGFRVQPAHLAGGRAEALRGIVASPLSCRC